MAGHSAAQLEASSQAGRLFRDVERYRDILPPQYRHHGGGGMCRADGWDVSNHQLDGDFALDEVLAKSVVKSVAPLTATSSATQADTSWLEQYLRDDPAAEIGSSSRFISEAKNAAAGPGNFLGNAGAFTQALNANMQGKTVGTLKAGAQKIASGAASNIKINPHMTLYNANKGKGAPRPRIRIQGLPLQVISPALGQGARMTVQHGSASARALMAGGQDLRRLGQLAGNMHWTFTAALSMTRVATDALTGRSLQWPRQKVRVGIWRGWGLLLVLLSSSAPQLRQ